MESPIAILDKETGEVVEAASLRERFDTLPLDQQAEGYAALELMADTLRKALTELRPLMSQRLRSVAPDPHKPTVLPVLGMRYELFLSGGKEEKRLDETETRAFLEALEKLKPGLAEKVIERRVPKLNKKVVNELRKVPGKVAELIQRTFTSHPKSVELRENKKFQEATDETTRKD